MIAILYIILCVILPCIVYQTFVLKIKAINKQIIIHLIEVYLFLIYISVVFAETGIGTIWDIGRYGELIRRNEITIIPFQSDDIVPYLLNVLMFIPMGILLPFIWIPCRKLTKTLFSAALFSLSIEVLQLFNRRTTDIDDLLMNSIGAMLGYLIWFVLRNKTKCVEAPILLSKYEPIVYMLISLLAVFFLYNYRWIFT